ncbi:hypothetical protein [Qipengyuania gelatinilytica]|uniref:Uncharacterized protein n=1 Tax=Qipengyuania gelatinilytica TaxID=2867231 RepID=A0ABX9A544_9SPHN|nr:hypothetical protein [Qipengyuania gelatinilytica]QZD96219.1 hypothetical protein K3136_05885 [Qipengyuania gelatinilytica]
MLTALARFDETLDREFAGISQLGWGLDYLTEDGTGLVSEHLDMMAEIDRIRAQLVVAGTCLDNTRRKFNRTAQEADRTSHKLILKGAI